MSTIAINGLVISVPSMLLPDGSMSEPINLDLAAYTERYHRTMDTSKKARLYMMLDGEVALNPGSNGTPWWLLAEVDLPAPEYDIETVPGDPKITTHEVSIERGEGKVDVVPLDENQSIGRVGFSWAPYKTPDDYTTNGGEITWSSGPEPGDRVVVEIITATPTEIENRTALPINLSAATVTLYDLPEEK